MVYLRTETLPVTLGEAGDANVFAMRWSPMRADTGHDKAIFDRILSNHRAEAEDIAGAVNSLRGGGLAQ